MLKKLIGILLVGSMISAGACLPVSAENTETVAYNIEHSIELSASVEGKPNAVSESLPCNDNRVNTGIKIDDAYINTQNDYTGIVFGKIVHPEAAVGAKLRFKVNTTQTTATNNRTIKFTRYLFTNNLPEVPPYYCNVRNTSATHYCNPDITCAPYLNWLSALTVNTKSMVINVNPLDAANTAISESDTETDGVRTVNLRADSNKMLELDITPVLSSFNEDSQLVIVTEALNNVAIYPAADTQLIVEYDTTKYISAVDKLFNEFSKSGVSAEDLTMYFNGVKDSDDFADYNTEIYNKLAVKNLVWQKVLAVAPSDNDGLKAVFNSAVQSLVTVRSITADEDAFVNGTAYNYMNNSPTMGQSKYFVSQFDLSEINNAPIISADYSNIYSLCSYLNETYQNKAGAVEIGTVKTLNRFGAGTITDYFEATPVYTKAAVQEMAFDITTTDATTNDSTNLKNFASAQNDITAELIAAKAGTDEYIGIYAKPSMFAKLYGKAPYLADTADKNGVKSELTKLTVTYDRTARAAEALNAINSADAASVEAVLREYDVEFGMNASNLDSLSDSAISDVCGTMISRSFTDVGAVADAFGVAIAGKENAKVIYDFENVVTEEGTNSRLVRTASFTKLKDYSGSLKIVAGYYINDVFYGIVEITDIAEINKIRYAKVGDSVTVKFGSNGMVISKQAQVLKVFVLEDYSTLRPLAAVGTEEFIK